MCLFINPNYVNLLDLLLTSLALYANLNVDTTDILVFTDETLHPQIEAVAQRLGLPVLYSFLTIDTKWEASCARLKLFGYEHIDNYDKILYIDTDILLNKDINTLFALDILDTKVYATGEGRLGVEWWGSQFFNFELRKTLPSWSTTPFNEWTLGFCAGILFFRNSQSIRDLFNNINKHIHQYIYVDKNPPPEFWDQPFIVYNCVIEDKYDNVLMNTYACNCNRSLEKDYIIYHYPCGPGWYEQKFEIMSAISKIQKKYITPRTPLLGEGICAPALWRTSIHPDWAVSYKYLEIGVGCGHSLVTFEYIYGMDSDSHMYGIDTWDEGYETCLANIRASGVEDKFTLIKGHSYTEIPKLTDDFFHMMYINCDCESATIMENAVLAFRKLKLGGCMIFNNYSMDASSPVKKAVDSFTTMYNTKLRWHGITSQQNIFIKTSQ